MLQNGSYTLQNYGLVVMEKAVQPNHLAKSFSQVIQHRPLAKLFSKVIRPSHLAKLFGKEEPRLRLLRVKGADYAVNIVVIGLRFGCIGSSIVDEGGWTVE